MPTSLWCQKTLKIFFYDSPKFISSRLEHKTEILLWHRIQFRIICIYTKKRRVKQNLLKSSESYISNSSGGEPSSTSMSSIPDNSDTFSKPKVIICRIYNIYISTFIFYIGLTNIFNIRIVKFERTKESKNFHKPKLSNRTDALYQIHLANPTKLLDIRERT